MPLASAAAHFSQHERKGKGKPGGRARESPTLLFFLPTIRALTPLKSENGFPAGEWQMSLGSRDAGAKKEAEERGGGRNQDEK